MSRNSSLSTQTSKHFVVIRKNRTYPIKVITDFLNDNYKEWALICHEKDIDSITGEVIPPHYHYVGNAIKKDQRLSTSLKALANKLKTDTNGIEFDKYRTLENSLQYLIHKNNPEKTQHKIEEILFNGWSLDELKTFITSDSTGLNFDRVLLVCKTYSSIVDVIRELGFINYSRYRATIRDIFEEVHPLKSRPPF